MNDLAETLRRALDARGPGPVELDIGDVPVELDVLRKGPVGVELGGLRLRAPSGDVGERCQDLCARFRPRGERLTPVEVDPALGGAVLRTRPEDLRRGRYFEVQIDAASVELSRWRRRPGGGRDRAPFPLSHEELGEWLEDLLPAVGRGDRD